MMKVRGDGAIQGALTRVKRAKNEQMRVAMLKAALFVQRESQKLCPVDTSTLVNSAMSGVEREGNHVWKGTVSYNTHYAVYVHEDLNAHHPIGQAKYLEDAARNNHAKIRNIISTELKRKSK